MRKLEDFMNSLTDQDWGWWPVVFLRPPKNREINSIVLLKMMCFFGPVTGLVIFLVRFRNLDAVTFGRVVFHLVLGCVVFFVFYRLTFAHFWNRRARRLRIEETQPSTSPK
jgi:hypothetical protein